MTEPALDVSIHWATGPIAADTQHLVPILKDVSEFGFAVRRVCDNEE